MKRNFWFFFLILFFSLSFFTKSFLPGFLFLYAEKNPEWEIFYTKEEIEKYSHILNQSWRFLDHGSQCWAFVSQDQEYVLKICKKSRGAKKERLQSDFSSYLLAFEFLKEECQMVFLHLSSNGSLQLPLQLMDPLGFVHVVESDHLCFYIQKKLLPLSRSHSSFISPDGVFDEKLFASELIQLCRLTSKQPVRIRDIQFKNIGVFQNHLFWIDPGRIRKKTEENTEAIQQSQIKRMVYKLRKGLKSISPSLRGLTEQMANDPSIFNAS